MSLNRTVITVTVLSEGPLDGDLELRDIAYECDEGSWVGAFDVTAAEELDGKQMADALYAAGSEPGFFQLDDDGRNVDELDDEDDS